MKNKRVFNLQIITEDYVTLHNIVSLITHGAANYAFLDLNGNMIKMEVNELIDPIDRKLAGIFLEEKHDNTRS